MEHTDVQTGEDALVSRPFWAAWPQSAGVRAAHNGQYTSGQKFCALQPCIVLGAYFYTARTTAHTVRVKLWRTGTGAAVATVDVDCAGAGLYEARFSAPYTVVAADVIATVFVISVCDVGPATQQYTDITPNVYVLQAYTVWGYMHVGALGVYAVGDSATAPTTASATQNYCVDPIVKVG